MTSWNATLRLGIVLVVLIGMPVLAMPDVNRKVTEWLRTNVANRLPTDFMTTVAAVPQNDSATPPAPVVNPLTANPIPAVAGDGGVQRTTFEDSQTPSREISPSAVAAPLLFPTPQRTPDSSAVAPPMEVQLRRVREIRLQLEELGADYVLLESLDDLPGGRYRFYCLMYVDSAGKNMQPFEEVANDPQVAAENVLAKVQAWRRQTAVRR